MSYKCKYACCISVYCQTAPKSYFCITTLHEVFTGEPFPCLDATRSSSCSTNFQEILSVMLFGLEGKRCLGTRNVLVWKKTSPKNVVTDREWLTKHQQPTHMRLTVSFTFKKSHKATEKQAQQEQTHLSSTEHETKQRASPLHCQNYWAKSRERCSEWTNGHNLVQTQPNVLRQATTGTSMEMRCLVMPATRT